MIEFAYHICLLCIGIAVGVLLADVGVPVP